MKNRTWGDSFRNAAEGIKYVFQTQKNMRFHLSSAAVAILAGWLLGISPGEFVLVLVAISLVLISEMVNTAVEKTVDLFMSTYHPLAKIAKNVAAGAVLIAAVNALLIGAIVLGVPLFKVFVDFFR